MTNSELSRKFIEAMLRLKRDTIKQAELKVLPTDGLLLKFGEYENITISYVINSCSWSLLGGKLAKPVWNPTLNEVVEFINNFSEEEINKTIDKLYYDTIVGYGRINSIGLLNKFEQILHLLEFEENLENNLEFESKDGTITIFYSVEHTNLMFHDYNTPDKIYLNEISLMNILKNTNYLVALKALNKTYSELKRKK